MNRRFKHIEESDQREIDTRMNEMNRLVVVIDECADLIGKVSKQNPDYDAITKAQEYMDLLARKSRACGIHLIMATQRISEQSIPTRIQENLGGRLAFKVKTPENSMRMLGNNLASNLPGFKGRAIWATNFKDLEIQVPYVSDKFLRSKIKEYMNLLEKGHKSYYPLTHFETGVIEKSQEQLNGMIEEEKKT